MRFEKISKEQYYKDLGMKEYEVVDNYNYGNDYHIQRYEDIILPRRATKHSAGYDIFSTQDFILHPGHTIKIPTGLRVILDPDKFLLIVPRSGMGFKTSVRLSNTVGIIDADYSDSDNEGHFWVKLTYPILNGIPTQKPLEIHKGDAICQGIICPFYKVEEDDVETHRNGGFGSTSK